MKHISYILILLICLTANEYTFGQFSNTRNSRPQDTNKSQKAATKQGTDNNLVPDSIDIKYYHFDTPSIKFTYQDSTLNEHFHQIDPAKKIDFEYFNLGNIGSSAYPIIFNKNSNVGFHIGQNQYELYNYTKDNVRIYEPSSPFVNARFSPYGDEQTFVIKTDFARKFSDGTGLSINYNRIKQAGTYINQNTFITNFASNFSFKRKKYKGQILFISNVNDEHINGGIEDMTQVLLPNYQSRTLVDINLAKAIRRNQEKTLLTQHRYSFSNHIHFGTDIGYANKYYKYSDTEINKSDFYGTYWIDNRGIRQYIKTHRWSINPYLLFNYKSSYLRTGISYDYINIDDEASSQTQHQIFVFGIGKVQFAKGFSLDYNGQLGLGSATGLLDLRGDINIDLKSNLKFRGGVNLFRHAPSYLAQRVALNHQIVYENDFNNPYGLSIVADLKIPFLKAKLSAKQTTINDAIYYDADGLPQQYNEIFNAISFMATHRLDIWKLHLENAIAYQIINENLYGNPTFYSKHNLFFESKMFKNNLLLRIGGETRIIPSYKLQGFNPVVGNFTQTGIQSTFYPRGDIYITARISKFRAFFKYSNLMKAFQNDVEYNVRYYPQYDNRFRMGIAWMFLN